MEKKRELLKTPCLNCGASIEGRYCHNCGQSARDNSDRSMGRLIGEFLGSVFFLDNRFLLSVSHLLGYPGRMTVGFLAGRRKKYLSPIALFLFFNLVYFLVNPLSDYSLTLTDQVYSQPYSPLIIDLVTDKLKNEGLNGQAYAQAYQAMSDTISKSVMILNVPIIAFFVYLMSFRRRRFYFDSLIFSFHYFTLFLISWVMMDWADTLIDLIAGGDGSLLSSVSGHLFMFGIPCLYAILSIKKFMGIAWYWAVPAGAGVVVSVLLANLIYRFVIFFATFWAT